MPLVTAATAGTPCRIATDFDIRIFMRKSNQPAEIYVHFLQIADAIARLLPCPRLIRRCLPGGGIGKGFARHAGEVGAQPLVRRAAGVALMP